MKVNTNKTNKPTDGRKTRTETATQRKRRLKKAKQYYKEKRAIEDESAKRARLEKQRMQRQQETAEQRAARLSSMRNHIAEIRAAETPEQHQARIARVRRNISLSRDLETPEQRQARLEQLRLQRERLRSDVETFEASITTFCDRICAVCTKRCYPNQIISCSPSQQASTYLPDELKTSNKLNVCYRCKNHITSKKMTWPPKAYWNNLDPGVIPDEILALTQAEKRLLSRIIPFVKVVKLSGVFGQYGFRGQAVLFAQDIFEISEKLPNMLPRSSDNCGLVVVTEHLENLDITREYSMSPSRMNAALRWLIVHNPLYKDVTIDSNIRINERDVIRVIQSEPENVNNHADHESSAYMPIGDESRIVRASWHQGNDAMFANPGVQCAAMVLANIVRATILPPSRWNTLVLDRNMIEGDFLYGTIRTLSTGTQLARIVGANGFLEVRDFDVIKTDFSMFNNNFSIEYAAESPFYGSLQDSINSGPGKTLIAAIEALFQNYSAGILIADHQSLGVMHYDGKYYFTDSHSCGARGAKAQDGRACIIECDNIEELVRKCKRATGSRNIQFTLDYIQVHSTNDIINECDEESVPVEEPVEQGTDQQQFAIQTSVMAPIDCAQPDVEDELEVSDNINEITRKTRDNIVNEAHEWKAEEYAWYYLFPYGKNGLKEQRLVSITPLDYYQYRVMGQDTRFQIREYLFYALSMFEYYRTKSTIAACGKKIEGQDGQIEDLHLYIKNLRGSAAYWRTALNELIAQIRCLGPPTYFVTFSCNDLNWLDMRKALLIADGRPNDDPSSLDMYATQVLVEKYPVIVSRHFAIRTQALMKFIQSNTKVFGGRVKDFWWRVEFQNRGSPHLHMVVWIEDHPPFDTPEGLAILDRNCSCEMPDEGSEIYDLVKKCQVHRHTQTCRKNDPASNICRFSFPRQVCDVTKIVAHSSDDFVRNGGRICLLKRRQQDRWDNNYNPTLLKLWKGNMDIQPCGSNEAIAFYIAKYMSKSEPTELDTGIAQAIQQIRREETNISRKLFKICMRILRERQVSACEAVYRLGHLKMRDSSRKCVFLNTRKYDQRYKVLQFDEHGRATGYCKSLFDRYEQRPDNLENMCLVEFAMLYEPHYNKRQGDSEESIDDIGEETTTRRQLLTLKDNSKMVVRNTPAVVRVPYFMASSDEENYYLSLLQQYMPYRNEDELTNGYANAKAAFTARELELKEMNRHMEVYRARDKQLENAFNQIHALEVLERPESAIVENDEEEIEIDDAMDDAQFANARSNMNDGQSSLYELIRSSIENQLRDEQAEPKRLFITGGAGTGKTFVFNLLKNLVYRCYGKHAAKVAALTGVAARLVGGLTIHSLLKLPVQKDGRITNLPLLTGNYLRMMRLQWKDCKFLFIDEISMVPYEMLCMIDSRLRQIKNIDQPFGGMNVLLFGDLMQLPPIRGHQVFQQPEKMVPATHLWRLFKLVELTQNMRQQGDTTFRDILNALRIGELQPQHLAVLMDKVGKEPTGEFSLERALRILPTNQQVADHNQAVLQYFRDKHAEMFTIKAQDTLVDATRNTDNLDLQKVTPTDINNTAGLPKELEIFVGAKVMLRSNIDVAKGLVNGLIGHITEIIWPLYHRGQLHEHDIPSVRVDFGNNNIHLISPITKSFPAKYSYGTMERRMLPIILSWASTVHKMQGSTVDYAVIDLGNALFASGQAYVALSRVRSLDGLQILDIDCTKLTGKKPCNNEALAEMDRLRLVPDN